MITETIEIFDMIKIRCLLPVEYFITLRISTQQAADYANKEMRNKDGYFLTKATTGISK